MRLCCLILCAYVSFVSFSVICPMLLCLFCDKSKVLFLLFRSFFVCLICKCMRDFTLWVLNGSEGLKVYLSLVIIG